VLAESCLALNTEWNKWISTGMPYVIAKAAMTLDGRINSPPDSRWITSEPARQDAMKLRQRVQAILVGGGTVRADDPQLTVRGISPSSQPWRVVWTKSGQLPPTATIFTDPYRERTLVLKGISLRSALRELGSREIASVLIEGGGHVLGEAFDASLVDEVCFYMAPIVLGGAIPVTGGQGVRDNEHAVRLSSVRFKRIGSDVRMTATVAKK
jgi:diaminohydroxyphosphoribosylaminopyrimidine deaminase/5-amino-6-(5-phosphoribosylamino)uracil reductase